MPTRYLGSLPLKSARRRRHRKRSKGAELSCNISVPEESEASEDASSLSLEHWGLPPSVLEAYKGKGLSHLFPWQSECLQSGSALEGKSLVYSAPTSGGKTLVAEILLLKSVIERKKKALFILPFVSLAREKMRGLSELLRGSNLRVEGYMGSLGPKGGLARFDIAVCTIEKANGLLNRAMEEGQMESIGIIVIDELHLLGDPSRGYLLELMLTKTRYIAGEKIQIVGMSATLPNLDLIADWLDADLYVTDYRPIPLEEMIKVDNVLYSREFHVIRSLEPLLRQDGDCLIQLCLETVAHGQAVLVFCPTKSWCEKVAESIAKEFFGLGSSKGTDAVSSSYGVALRRELNGDKLGAVIESLRRTPAGLDALLGKTVAFGVAFHHAGLTMDERDIIESSFKSGELRILVATSTLSSGVNLPARRVIIRSPFSYGNQLIDSLSYRQMIGRAGRKGIDTKGESILFCRGAERTRVEELIRSDLTSVQSCLVQFKGDHLCSSMKRAILEIIAGNVAKNKEEVQRYTSCTMLAASLRRDGSQSEEVTRHSLSNCIEFLENNEFIRTQESSSGISYMPTHLGLACLASSLAPDEGLQVFEELSKARKCFVLENELQLVYLLVPIYAAVSWPNLDWMNYLTIWESLSPDFKRVGEIVGIEERFLIRAMRGSVNTSVPKQMKSMAVHQRFYTTLALHDLINEVPLPEVTAKYGASKGMLQGLQSAASTFAGMVTVFCNRLGWLNMELLLSQFGARLQFGVTRELIDLTRLSSLNGHRARALFNASIESVASLANSNADDIVSILLSANPFQSSKGSAGRKTYWINAQKGHVTMEEGAKMILTEARALLEKDLGMELSWGSDEKASEPSFVGHKDGAKRKRLSEGLYAIPSNKSSVLRSPVRKVTTPVRKRKSTGGGPLDEPLVSSSPHQLHNSSLNMSSIVDEIFEGEEFSVDMVGPSQSSSTTKTAKNVHKPKSFNGHPKDNDSEMDMFENEDLFLDTWRPEEEEEEEESKGAPSNDVKEDAANDINKKSESKLEELENHECIIAHKTNSTRVQTRRRKTYNKLKGLDSKPGNKSCPETPKYEACSEELDLVLIETTAAHSQEQKQPSVLGAEEEEEIVFEDSVLSDSLLEKAFNTHMMSEEDLTGIIEEGDGTHNNNNSSLCNETTGDPGKMNVIDVCSSKDIFKEFSREILELKDPLTFSIAAASFSPPSNTAGGGVIGAKFRKNVVVEKAAKDIESSSMLLAEGMDLILEGISFSWGSENNDAYYLCLNQEQINPNDTIAPPTQDPSIRSSDRLALLNSIFTSQARTFISFSLKEQLKVLYLSTGIWPSSSNSFVDPKIASWLLNPGGKEKSLPSLVLEFLPEYGPLLRSLLALSAAKGVGCLGMIREAGTAGLSRAASLKEVLLCKHLLGSLDDKLESLGLKKSFEEVEMPALIAFLNMELNGVGFSEEESSFQRNLILDRMEELEARAYKLAKRPFSLSSPKDLIQVLYFELRLPHNGDEGISNRKKRTSLLSTNKETLIRLQKHHELPSVVLEWRKLNASITKVVYPMQRAKTYIPGLDMHRLYTVVLTHSSTGRISLVEPNLQNIPKDFEIPKGNILVNEGDLSESFADRSMCSVASFLDSGEGVYTVSMRHAVVAAKGCILLAADYSQLELRILAHLSGDSKLRNILNDAVDVFKLIAAKWKRRDVEEISANDRQSAKQMVYGILYGIGPKALGEQLGVPEEEASVFMGDFKDTFPQIRTFIERTIASAKASGFVTTITGRRRLLPNLQTSSSAPGASFIISQSERQAVNTVIQGSAADLVKSAMVGIHGDLQKKAFCTRPLRKSSKISQRRGSLILQIHDELLYEVSLDDLQSVARIIKTGMESAIRLSVNTPVNLKAGPSWGTLKEHYS